MFFENTSHTKKKGNGFTGVTYTSGRNKENESVGSFFFVLYSRAGSLDWLKQPSPILYVTILTPNFTTF